MILALSLLACTAAKDDSAGDTATEVTLADGTQFIFTRNCAFSGCHGDDNPAQGTNEAKGISVVMNLSEGRAHAALVDVDSEEVPSMKRVVPGDPESSYLWYKVTNTHAEVGGVGTRMPPELLLAETDQAIIRAWIEGGARP